MNFFGKAKKSKKTPTSDDDKDSSSPPKSPPKKSSISKSSKAGDENYNSQQQGSSRSSRSFPKPGRNSARTLFDPNTTHPLNLPPEQLRRLSALSNMSDPIEVDTPDGHNGTASPPPQAIPSSFDTSKTTSGTAANEAGPAPPPHKSDPSSPSGKAAPTSEEAEAFKVAGNKFYKTKEYKKAIDEYTKGIFM
jgi:DnaJ family protein C protein 7